MTRPARTDLVLQDDDVLEAHDLDRREVLRRLRLRAGLVGGDEQERADTEVRGEPAVDQDQCCSAHHHEEDAHRGDTADGERRQQWQRGRRVVERQATDIVMRRVGRGAGPPGGDRVSIDPQVEEEQLADLQRLDHSRDERGEADGAEHQIEASRRPHSARPFQVSVPRRCRRHDSATRPPSTATDAGCASTSGMTRAPVRRATSRRPPTPAA